MVFFGGFCEALYFFAFDCSFRGDWYEHCIFTWQFWKDFLGSTQLTGRRDRPVGPGAVSGAVSALGQRAASLKSSLAATWQKWSGVWWCLPVAFLKDWWICVDLIFEFGRFSRFCDLYAALAAYLLSSLWTWSARLGQWKLCGNMSYPPQMPTVAMSFCSSSSNTLLLRMGAPSMVTSRQVQLLTTGSSLLVWKLVVWCNVSIGVKIERIPLARNYFHHPISSIHGPGRFPTWVCLLQAQTKLQGCKASQKTRCLLFNREMPPSTSSTRSARQLAGRSFRSIRWGQTWLWDAVSSTLKFPKITNQGQELLKACEFPLIPFPQHSCSKESWTMLDSVKSKGRWALL